MDCPKCPGKLEDHKIEGLEISRCFACEGLWFDAGELEEVIKRDSKDFDYIDVGDEEYDGTELKQTGINVDRKVGKCPRCTDNTMLVQRQYESKHSVIVDICPSGHGIWLDGGEIEQLRHRGMAKLHDHVAYYKEMFSVVFTKAGFKDILKKSPRLIKDMLTGVDPKKDPEL